MSPPELRAVVEDGRAPGRAIDLGCGTGTNVVYLAERGWRAVGVDFVGRAIERARRRALDAGVEARVELRRADVTRLGDLGRFDLALDMGCLHSVPSEGRSRYAAWLARSLRPGAPYLLYAFTARVGEVEVRRLFADAFVIDRVEAGTDQPASWYFLRRGEARA